MIYSIVQYDTVLYMPKLQVQYAHHEWWQHEESSTGFWVSYRTVVNSKNSKLNLCMIIIQASKQNRLQLEQIKFAPIIIIVL